MFALKQIVFTDKYPHLTLKIFVTILATEENVKQLINSNHKALRDNFQRHYVLPVKKWYRA